MNSKERAWHQRCAGGSLEGGPSIDLQPKSENRRTAGRSDYGHKN